MFHGHDLESTTSMQDSPFPCEFDRAFVGLGATIGEKYLMQPAMYCEELRKPDHRIVIESRAATYQALRLPSESSNDRAWRMAQAVDSPPLNEIEKAATLRVTEPRAFTRDKDDRRSRRDINYRAEVAIFSHLVLLSGV